MPYPTTKNNWIIQYDGKPTFFGILSKYFDQMGERYRLNQATRESYAKEYERHILPKINSKPLESYTGEELEQVITDIMNSGTDYAQSTLKHYRLLIKRVVDIAVQEEGMKDPLWGLPFGEVTTPKEVEEQERKTLPKSLTPLQQCSIGEAIYAAAVDAGDMLGLMLTYESGLRLKESAGVSIGDFIKPLPAQNFSHVAVHNATIAQSHKRHGKVKTSNGYRLGILGPRATAILYRQIEEIQKRIDKGDIVLDANGMVPEISAMPIASSRKDPLAPCSSPQLSSAYRIALRNAGYENEEFLAAQRIVESDEYIEAERRVTPKELGFADEKDPSAYSARRQYCTDMHIVGCVQDERQFAMGHRIENPAVDRRDFRNEDKLRALAEKLNKRPVINPQVLEPNEIKMEGASYQNPDFHNETIRIPAKKGKYIIRITSNEPLTPATATFAFPKQMNARCKYYQHQSSAQQRREVNILNDYYEAFRQAYALLEQRKVDEKQDTASE